MITRNDLSVGKQAAQITHGIIEFCLEYPEITNQWHNESNYVVVLSVENEETLINLLMKAKNKNIKCSYFSEPDLNNALTCLVLEPTLDSKKICSNIKLLGR